MADKSASAANGERIAFTVRYDESFVADLDERRDRLGAILGFEVSRQDYLKHACRQFWGQDDASDDVGRGHRE